jgi:integrase
MDAKAQRINHVMQQFIEDNPTIAQSCKRRKISQKGCSKVPPILRSFLEAIYPADATEAPSKETLHIVQQWAHATYKTPAARRRFVATTKSVRLHQEIIATLTDFSLTKEQALVYEKVRNSYLVYFPLARLSALSKAAFLCHVHPLTAKTNKTLDSSSFNLAQGTLYCMESCNLGPFRPVILLCTGFSFSCDELKASILRFQGYKEMFESLKLKNANWKVTHFLEFVAQHGTPEELSTKQPRDVLNALASVHAGKHSIWKLYEHHFLAAGKAHLVDYVERHGDFSLTKINNFTKLQGMSAWHAEACNAFVEFERTHRTGNVSIIDKNDKLKTSRFASFMLFMDEYATLTRHTTLCNFLKAATRTDILSLLVERAKSVQVCNDRVVARQQTHQSNQILAESFYFLRGPLEHLLDSEMLHTIKKTEVLRKGKVHNDRIAALNKRRSFSQEEIQQMMAHAEDPAEEVVLSLLHRVALRASATGNIKYEQLFDKHHNPNTQCVVLDKGNKKRYFMMPPDLREKCSRLSQFLRSLHADEVLLKNCYPLNLSNIQKRYSYSSLCHLLARVAKKANITDVRIHPHAWRHTYVEHLVDLGVPIVDVSKLIGHSHVGTTSNSYYVPTHQKLYAKVTTFVDKKKQSEAQHIEMKQAIMTCLKIINTLDSVIKSETDSRTYRAIQTKLTLQYPHMQQDLASAASGLQEEEEEEEEEEEAEEKEKEEEKQRAPDFKTTNTKTISFYI